MRGLNVLNVKLPRHLSRALAACVLSAPSVALCTLVVTLGACESAANLDVTYGDSSAPIDAGGGATLDGATPSTDGGESGDGATPIFPVLTGCPCDPTQGIGCCLPSNDRPFCTTAAETCANATGTLLKCVGPDPSTESQCCWHGSGSGAVTALAAFCDAGPTACTKDTDCAGTGETKCALASCFAGTIVIGACGSVAPKCPQP